MTEFQKSGKVREFFCLKFIFSQVEDLNFDNFMKGLRLTVELNPGLEKSGTVFFILSEK